MGMATYYLKARFRSAKAAETALSKFIAIVNEGMEAERFWRTNQQPRDDAFWLEFKQRFPQIFDFLGPNLRGDRQRVSYALNFGDRDDPSATVQGRMLLFSAYVWHFADWASLAKFVKTRLGALGVDWISEECMDPLDLLHP